MKRIIFLIVFLSLQLIKAQIVIGKDKVDGSGILDFADNIGTVTRGIVLPVVTVDNADLTAQDNGTLLVDREDKKVKVLIDGTWVDLSDPGDISKAIDLDQSQIEDNQAHIIIGDQKSKAKGVLVLEATDKALILPRIKNPATEIKSPSVGMICYDTESKSFAIFDGKVWNYWK